MIAAEALVNEKILSRFERLIKNGRLAHAYLLVGPQGSGKFETALAVARAVNCESADQGFCGTCSSCKKIDSGNHPDIVICDRGENQSIKIQKVRELVQRIQMRPYEAKRKVVILREMDTLTTEGANAFLKTLEEPTASSLLLLTTANPERILATVISRCHVVHFFAQSRQDLTQRLEREFKISKPQAEVIAGYSEGCYGKARFFQEDGFISRKNDVITQFLFTGIDEASLKSILSDQDQIKETLETLLFCFKDLMLLKAGGSDERITNSDRIQDFKTCAARYSLDQLRDVLAEIVNTKKMLDASLNVKIPFMLLKEKIWISS